MNLLSICNEPSTLNIIRIIVLLINIIKIVIPIVLIVFLAIKIMGAVASQNQDEITKRIRSSIPNIVAAVLIFLVPTFVDIIARLSMPNSDYAKCISGISKEKITAIYEEKIDRLVNQAEENERYSDYAIAYTYLQNIKNKELKAKYEQRLATLLKVIEEDLKEPPAYVTNKYSLVNYKNFKWTRYTQKSGPAAEYYNDITSYYVWAPENASDLNNVSLPLIVWLHGRGEIGFGDMTNAGLLKVVNNWNQYNLAPIPAIIVAPQTPEHGWLNTGDLKTIKALINYAKVDYNIDSYNISLMGHSMGGTGVVNVAPRMEDTFSSIVVMSGVPNVKKTDYPEYFAKIKMKGYAEDSSYKTFFTALNRESDFTLYNGTSHGDIPRKVLTEDTNKDGISDLMAWLYGENADTIYKPPAKEDDPSSGSSGSSSGDSGSGSGSKTPPTANPITKYVDVNSVNAKIASAVKSKGLYTRGAVVAAATTLINTLEASGYHIPYQLGGMYHRTGKWGVNPNWGTVIEHNDKMVLSGLDCRNFVNWSFQQAGLCLVRGYGAEASTDKSKVTNKYPNLLDGRPGDVIDFNGHIALIVSRSGDGYQIAESNGVGRARLYNISLAEMKSWGYSAYNMDAIYNNTAYTCSEKSPYNACDTSCHIDKSKFPSYYGY